MNPFGSYLIVTSNNSINYYPNNTLSCFKNNLSSPITIRNDESWYMGLISATFAPIQEATKDCKIKFTNIEIERGHRRLINILYLAKDFCKPLKKSSFFENFTEDLSIKFFRPDKTSLDYVRIQITETIECIVPVNIEFNCYTLFEYLFKQIPSKDWKLVKKFIIENLSLNGADTLDMSIKKITQKMFVVERINEDPKYLCLYCDSIEPRFCGNVNSRMLYMHPLVNKNLNDPQTLDVQHIQYFKIENTRLSDINILITDEKGVNINFKDGTFFTQIVLHLIKNA